MVTTQKPSFNPHNGSIRNHHGQESSGSSQQCESDADLFFDSCGIVHHEYAPEDQTINEYYLQILCRLREAVRRKRHDMWAAKNFQLHHGNTLAHSANVIHAFLSKLACNLLDRLLTLPTWHSVTSGCSPSKNNFEREAISIKRQYEKIRGAWEHSGGV